LSSNAAVLASNARLMSPLAAAICTLQGAHGHACYKCDITLSYM